MSEIDNGFRIASIEEALDDIRAGKLVIVVDDEDRENEGDLITAAEKVTPEIINFMALYGRGLVCLPATSERLQELELEMMVGRNTALHGTPFTVSIDAVEGTTTGISAQDRAVTIQRFVDASARPPDFARPGHIFPLCARPGGVLRRAGHTEATVDLARLAGLYPAGVLCEILNPDGTMARLPQLMEMARQFNLKIITIRDLIAYRRRSEKLVGCLETVRLPTQFGEFKLHLYESEVDRREHVALTKGDLSTGDPVLVRMHSECLTGDTFRSLRCDCSTNLHSAIELIEREGRGAVVYMRQEGRGIGLREKIHAYQTSGGRLRYGGGESEAGIQDGRAGLRHRCADPVGSGHQKGATDHQQSGQAGGAGGVWNRDRGASACQDCSNAMEYPVFTHQTEEDGTHYLTKKILKLVDGAPEGTYGQSV